MRRRPSPSLKRRRGCRCAIVSCISSRRHARREPNGTKCVGNPTMDLPTLSSSSERMALPLLTYFPVNRAARAAPPPLGTCHMLKIYSCVAYAHDLKLVALAAAICVLASFAAINLLHHARKSSGHMRGVWLAVSAVSSGFGIWATHFVAMLAFTPGIPSGYNVILTILSLIAAVLLTGAGLAVSLAPNWRHGPWVGGHCWRWYRRDALHRHGGL
jgi:hypothetical protein